MFSGSKDRLHRAKTIDLCQNPLTVSCFSLPLIVGCSLKLSQKEPKLVRARKIPEWEAYDNEIADFARTLAEKGSLGSENAKAATEDVARLAGSVGFADAEATETDSAALSGNDEVHEGIHTKDEL